MPKADIKYKLMQIMTRHIGQGQAIPMTALHEELYGIGWNDKINDTRDLRKAITDLRNDGVPILASSHCIRGGYYLASAASELTEYTDAIKRQAIAMLARAARIKQVSLPELLGQMQLELGGGAE